MSRLTLRTRKKTIRHPNFIQKHHKKIGSFLLIFGVLELILTCFLIFFIPDPFISPIPEAFTGKRPVLDDSVTIALRKILAKHEISYSQIYTTRDGDYLLALKPEGEVLLPKSADLEKEISSLQLILARITMEGKQFSRLDLRFEKPVIVFK